MKFGEKSNQWKRNAKIAKFAFLISFLKLIVPLLSPFWVVEVRKKEIFYDKIR